ncbi:CHASE domain-containing protein [Rubripirellula reticaptiva]|uniref:histidine kinase n=1 Tax=Rubripirellula reticaptiva TaxID=2528013 RepID=A0A5C6EF12_9BACT|nr:CHASE domain-containing protein [Rubripirellula reticaptiva]TWU47105.1 Phytochrome-like protein cph1 [Rubripirellula reticaptiva]
MIHHYDRTTNGLRQKLERTGSFQWFHWLVIGLSLGLTLFAWHYARVQQNAKIELQFDREADQAVSLVVDRMATYEEALWSGVAFVTTINGEVDYQTWDDYAACLKLDNRYPGINGIGLIASLGATDLDPFLKNQRVSRPAFTVHPKVDGNEHWPIFAISPIAGNEQAVGLDMMHEINRITAARKARDTKTTQITGPITLVQDATRTPGFLFFAPYYRTPTSAQHPNASETFEGLVYAPFVVRELIYGTLEKSRRRIGIRISDMSEVLFDEHVKSDPDFDPRPLVRKEISLDLYGRTWLFDVRSTRSFRQSIDSSQSTSILVAGLLINAMLLGLFYLISKSARRSLGLADQMTEELACFSLAASVNQIGIFDIDIESKKFKWNDAMYKLFQQNRDSFTPTYESVLGCIHPDDRPALEAAFRGQIDDGETLDSEYRIQLEDGENRHLHSRAVIFRDTDGRAIRLLGSDTDITETREATQELDLTRRVQSAIQDAAGVSMITTNESGLILSVNKTVESMLGYSREELECKKTPAPLHDADEIIQRAAELTEQLGREIKPGFEVFTAMTADGAMEQREWTYIRKDGTRFPVLLTVTAIRDNSGTVTGYLGVAADISDRKEADLAIAKSNEQLARSNEELAQFAYVASHDLQEPLRKVTSFCELLQEDCSDQLNEDGTMYMGYIMDGARRMRKLIQDLLAYSRIEEGDVRIETVIMNDALSVAINDLSTAVQESDATVTFDELPQISAPPSQMVQLFQNLIGNAIKYRGDESPRVHISCESDNGNHVFSVDDNGIGIAPEYRDQVFGIFKRLHGQSQYKGTGIGLAICKRILERVNGKIWIEDSPLGGSRFRFSINSAT